MQTSFVLLSSGQVRALIEAECGAEETFTAAVKRLASEWGISEQTLWRMVQRGVTARVDKPSLQVLQHATQQGVAPDWLQLRSFLTPL